MINDYNFTLIDFCLTFATSTDFASFFPLYRLSFFDTCEFFKCCDDDIQETVNLTLEPKCKKNYETVDYPTSANTVC